MKYIITFMFIVSMIIPINAGEYLGELQLKNPKAKAYFKGKLDSIDGDEKLEGTLNYTFYADDSRLNPIFYANSNSNTEEKVTFTNYWKSDGDSKFYFNFEFFVANSDIKLYGTFDDEELPSLNS